MNYELYIRRRGKVVPPATSNTELLPLGAVAALSINLEGLGYAISPELLEACRRLTLYQLGGFHYHLVHALSKMVGSDKNFEPMYLNFPHQVMEADAAELYI